MYVATATMCDYLINTVMIQYLVFLINYFNYMKIQVVLHAPAYLERTFFQFHCKRIKFFKVEVKSV